jgi:hypothetical protein
VPGRNVIDHWSIACWLCRNTSKRTCTAATILDANSPSIENGWTSIKRDLFRLKVEAGLTSIK